MYSDVFLSRHLFWIECWDNLWL